MSEQREIIEDRLDLVVLMDPEDGSDLAYEAKCVIADLRARLAIAERALMEYRKLERLSDAIGASPDLPKLTIASDAIDATKGGA